jgi:hypothetical protein
MIPIFPLHSVLFPHGRLSLQIFEIRYLDMIRHCLRTDSAFGVLLIKQGSEILQGDKMQQPAVERLGTLAHIVDWSGLSHQRLQITVEGGQRFRLITSEISESGLMTAEVEVLAKEPEQPLSMEFFQLASVLEGLLDYSSVRKLMIDCDLQQAVPVSYLLAQLLPIPETLKQELLDMPTQERLLRLAEELQRLGGEYT